MDKNLPSSLLILSRAFTITSPAAEAGAGVPGAGGAQETAKAAGERQAAAMRDIKDTLAGMPDEVVTSVTSEQSLAYGANPST